MNERIEINPRYEHLRDYIAALPSIFESSGEVIYKGRNEVRRMTAPDGTDIVVKRFGRLSFVRRTIYSTVESSKAKRAYDYGLRFLSMGIDTPEPIAYIEVYKDGLLYDAYFVSGRSEYQPLFGPLVEADEFDRGLADKVTRLMVDLHSHGAMHGDPNLNNILYTRSADGTVHLQVIDTNRSSFGSQISIEHRLKNLMRVSHRRDLLKYVAERYAELCGLDSEETVRKVMRMLDSFERNRRRRHRLKAIFFRKK